MTIFAMIFLLWAFMRIGRTHRMRHWHCGPGYVAYGQLHYRGRANHPRVRHARESAFESLKQRYVSGELSDSEYESELDAWLQTPEGRRTLH